MIKAILFDMVGVLFFVRAGLVATTTDEINANQIEKMFNHLDDDQLLADIKQQLRLTEAEIQRALPHIPEQYHRFEAFWDRLPSLKNQYKLAIINNGNSLALPYWQTIGDFSVFDLFINSAQVQVKKPDSRIFSLTCDRLQVLPNECLFVDDNQENTMAAAQLGMTTQWWDRHESPEKHLQIFLSQYVHVV
jgi:FMN phosphatase YigB (HAD superfamily)